MYKTIAKITKHISCVQEALLHVVDELRMRAFCHDSSKFEKDELAGFFRFELMPEGLEYGSEEYEAAMANIMKDNDCFKLHSKRNDHHPEHYGDVTKMRFQQIIEMVCDWAGAHLAYGNTGGWHQSVEQNIAKHPFLPEQKWLIRDVSLFLSSRIEALQDKAPEHNASPPTDSPENQHASIDDILNMPFSEVIRLVSGSAEHEKIAQDLITLLQHQEVS